MRTRAMTHGVPAAVLGLAALAACSNDTSTRPREVEPLVQAVTTPPPVTTTTAAPSTESAVDGPMASFHVLTEDEVRALLAVEGITGEAADCVVFILIAEWGPGSFGMPTDEANRPAVDAKIADTKRFCVDGEVPDNEGDGP